MESDTQKQGVILPPNFLTLYNEMISTIDTVSQSGKEPILIIAKKCILHARSFMARLKDHIAKAPFQDKQDEISFFKNVKPLFHCQLVFWTYVFNIELLRPVGSGKTIEKYLKKQLDRLNTFFISHAGFYSYYRSGETKMDEIYFLRGRFDEFAINPHSVDSDRSFSTSHDYLISRILSNDMVQLYLFKEIQDLKIPVSVQRTNPSAALHWTASKAGMVELIYALQAGGVYNNGNAEIKEIANCFQAMFQVDLGNYYHVFNEIRLRKKSRTQLLDQVKEKLIKKMDDMDEG